MINEVRYLSLNKYQLSSDDEAAMILGQQNEMTKTSPCGDLYPRMEEMAKTK